MPAELQSASPDGRFQITFDAWEASNSLWVQAPTVLDTRDNTPVLRFADERWSLDSSTWPSDSVAVLSLRKFPGNHRPSGVTLRLDCMQRSASIDGGAALPLDQLEAALERHLTWH